MAGPSTHIYERPAEMLQHLIRFDTTNPPGREAECIAYVDGLLRGAGQRTKLLARDPNRPNLITRLKGEGAAPPLLLYGHLDVVTTAGQKWICPPFEGMERDGYIWGRGALDMKGGISMMLSAFLRAKAEGLRPKGDMVFAALSDEEMGGDYGAAYLVENHPEEFEAVRYALGEFGGFPMHVGRQKYYLIQVAERQICWMRLTVRGPGGHGALPMRGGAMAKASAILEKLDRSRLPVHITPVPRAMIETMGATLGPFKRAALRALLRPALTDRILPLLDKGGRVLEPLLHNTVNATMIHAGEKANVIPSRVDLTLDGRILPGYGPEELFRELRGLIGEEAELEVIRYDPGPPAPDFGLFPLLDETLRYMDPDGVPLPLLLSGSSDARFFSRLGIQSYGFLPMDLPPGFDFVKLIHAENERIPVDALVFGARALYEVLRRYSG
jgi:acetylornithine deacetylase/succinyl-diaminopimelate desuccinylase-like protein